MRSVQLLGATVLFGSSCVQQPTLAGPLAVRNQHPAQLLVQHLDPAAATAVPAGGVEAQLDLAYTSVFLSGAAPRRSFAMDGEYLRVAPRLRVGLGGGLTAAAALPFAHTSGGFLDDFVIDYHDWFGFPDQGRDEAPRDEFGISLRRTGIGGGEVWGVQRDGFEWLDLPLELALQVLPTGPDHLGLAVRGGVELPTGDDDRGYGSGGIDGSFGAIVDYRPVGLGLYGHLQHTFAGTPARTRAAGLRFADVTSAGLAAELPLGEALHAFLQVEWETSTLREFDLAVVGRDQVLLWVGGRLEVETGWLVELGFGEDLAGKVSPDFTAWLGVVWQPWRRPRAAPLGLPR